LKKHKFKISMADRFGQVIYGTIFASIIAAGAVFLFKEKTFDKVKNVLHGKKNG